MPARPKRRVSPDDLYRLKLVTGFGMAPDGRHVVYSLQRVDGKTEKKYSNLWVVSTEGGEPRQFTFGDHVDSLPRWSPDGSQIAFLSNRGDEKQPQIYIIPFGGGEARRLTNLRGSFASLEWSPDGKALACQFRKKDREEVERDADEQKKKLGVVSRHVRRVIFKLDGTGYLPRERWHVWTIGVSGGRARQLTHGFAHDEEEPRWSPDGRSIVFISNRAKDPDLAPDSIDIFVLPARGGTMRRIPTPVGFKNMAIFSPDGRWISYLGIEGKGKWWKNWSLWIVPADGRGRPRDLTAKFDFHVASWTINDVPGFPAQMPPAWSKDGRRIFFQVARHGNTTLHSIGLDGTRRSLETVVGDVGVVGFFGLDRACTRLAYFHADMTYPGDFWLKHVASGKTHRLTRTNERVLAGLEITRPEEVWFKGAGDNDLQGWILKPPRFSPKKKHPSILEIHGGPRVQYGNFFMHEFHLLAASGYVVYYCNPRGGMGYGEAHSKAIWNAWGTVDYEDLMAWADFMARKQYIDRKRMGVAGGSYGGYMTNWIIGHTDRFRAAVTQRSVSNLVSMWGSSDFNWTFQTELRNKPPWKDIDNYWRQSPMKYIGNARTPTLILHNEMDLRCAIEQGEQIFVALKTMGVDAEMVRFPDEPHGLSREGRTDRRVERLRHIVRWFDRYLKS